MYQIGKVALHFPEFLHHVCGRRDQCLKFIFEIADYLFFKKNGTKHANAGSMDVLKLIETYSNRTGHALFASFNGSYMVIMSLN